MGLATFIYHNKQLISVHKKPYAGRHTAVGKDMLNSILKRFNDLPSLYNYCCLLL